jgi:hypothetical protein
MERLKKLDELTKPDPRNRLFVHLNRNQGVPEPLTLDYDHRCAAAIQLSPEVPEPVREYVEVVKTLFVYGWYYYPFCPVAGSLCLLVLEMALRMRLGLPGKRKPGLRGLFARAITKGLIKKRWASRVDLLEAWELAREAVTLMMDLPRSAQVSALEGSQVAKMTVELRNSFAHPEYLPLSAPDDALNVMTVCSEIINQLWPDSKRAT